ncbi:hypothetical protein IQ07DRAFT_679785 [Pyrenochaeta sp. DS3sAY3a]|nr:hypothetical protein IQ07DRAFT_679785 [Pyrenochaeta sp. DS3sAY3a]
MAPIEAGEAPLFHMERISQYVSLSPASLSSPLPALCASIFSPLLLSYFPPAKGIVLAYEDVQLSATPPPSSSASNSKSKSASRSKPHARPQQDDSSDSDEDEEDREEAPQQLLLTHIDEYSAPFLWATATLLIFRPQQNHHITATLTHASQTHITLSYLNTFPVAVLAAHLPASWTWQAQEGNRVKKGWDGRIADEGGWWVDGEGERVDVGKEIGVWVRDVEGVGKGRGKAFLRIEGSLVGIGEEAVAERGARKGKGKGKSVLKNKSVGE